MLNEKIDAAKSDRPLIRPGSQRSTSGIRFLFFDADDSRYWESPLCHKPPKCLALAEHPKARMFEIRVCAP